LSEIDVQWLDGQVGTAVATSMEDAALAGMAKVKRKIQYVNFAQIQREAWARR